MKTNLTKKEIEMVRVLFKNANNDGSETIGQIVEDNFSFTETKDFRKETGYSKFVVAGLISSLMEKGVLNFDEGNGFDKPDCWLLMRTFLEEFDPNIKFLEEDFLN